MTVQEIIDAMERHLPCPPNPMPESGTDADYLWRATLFNAQQDRPFRVVKIPVYTPVYAHWRAEPPSTDQVISTICVECDSNGRGVKVLRS